VSKGAVIRQRIDGQHWQVEIHGEGPNRLAAFRDAFKEAQKYLRAEQLQAKAHAEYERERVAAIESAVKESP
jgi:hypothetical protein